MVDLNDPRTWRYPHLWRPVLALEADYRDHPRSPDLTNKGERYRHYTSQVGQWVWCLQYGTHYYKPPSHDPKRYRNDADTPLGSVEIKTSDFEGWLLVPVDAVTYCGWSAYYVAAVYLPQFDDAYLTGWTYGTTMCRAPFDDWWHKNKPCYRYPQADLYPMQDFPLPEVQRDQVSPGGSPPALSRSVPDLGGGQRSDRGGAPFVLPGG